MGSGSSTAGFSPLSTGSTPHSFALAPPGTGSGSGCQFFAIAGQSHGAQLHTPGSQNYPSGQIYPSGLGDDCRIPGYKEKGKRSTGSQAFGEGGVDVPERDEGAEYIAPECDDGNVEYKLRLKNPSPVRFQQLVRTPLIMWTSACGFASDHCWLSSVFSSSSCILLT